jgi:hypothetical protein
MLYTAKLSFRNEEEIKNFPDRENLREFISLFNKKCLQKFFKLKEKNANPQLKKNLKTQK